jgi:hypothetical protein
MACGFVQSCNGGAELGRGGEGLTLGMDVSVQIMVSEEVGREALRLVEALRAKDKDWKTAVKLVANLYRNETVRS